MQSRDFESYNFILPAEKQPTLRLSELPLAKCAVVLLIVIIMAIVALSLGLWWDSVAPLSTQSLAA